MRRNVCKRESLKTNSRDNRSPDQRSLNENYNNPHLNIGAVLYTENSDRVPPYYNRVGPGHYQPDQTSYHEKVMTSLSKHTKS